MASLNSWVEVHRLLYSFFAWLTLSNINVLLQSCCVFPLPHVIHDSNPLLSHWELYMQASVLAIAGEWGRLCHMCDSHAASSICLGICSKKPLGFTEKLDVKNIVFFLRRQCFMHARWIQVDNQVGKKSLLVVWIDAEILSSCLNENHFVWSFWNFIVWKCVGSFSSQFCWHISHQ